LSGDFTVRLILDTAVFDAKSPETKFTVGK
jgi:hypothetical protein